MFVREYTCRGQNHEDIFSRALGNTMRALQNGGHHVRASGSRTGHRTEVTGVRLESVFLHMVLGKPHSCRCVIGSTVFVDKLCTVCLPICTWAPNTEFRGEREIPEASS